MTKAEDRRQKTEGKIVWILFAVAVIFLYFFALGSIPLLGPDEPRYAQVAREMFERGDWITPTLGGFNWFEKPALLYWLQIVSYKIFGVSEFAARFGAALFGLGTIFSLWILGRSFPQTSKKENENHLPFFSNWLFLISASSIGLLVFSRGATFDIILTFPVTAALVSFFIWENHHRDPENAEKKKNNLFTARHLSLAAFYFFIGVALLAKGLVGIIFPFAIVAFYYVLSRKLPPKTFILSLFWGTILSLIIAAAWYVPMFARNGWAFFDEFFVQHQFQRYTSNKYQHPQPFWFFWLVLPLMTIPWLPFFLAAIWDFVKGFFYGRNAKAHSEENQLRATNYELQNGEKPLTTRNSQLTAFAFAWLLVPLVFFSFSGSKLPGYILPALPAALLLTAEYAAHFVRGSRTRAIALQIVAFATFVFVFIALQFFVSNYARGETVKNLIEIADAQGYESEKILNFQTVSHSAEFYGAGRLVRTADGKQRRFFSAAEILREIKDENEPDTLILTPLEYLNLLTENDSVEIKVLGENGELAIVLLKAK